MTIVDNARDTLGADSWGQRLFFNKSGQRAPLTAERLSDVKASGVTMNGESAQSLGADANLLMIIQVPLKYRAPVMRAGIGAALDKVASGGAPSAAAAPAPAAEAKAARASSDVEAAVLGHGAELGPYTELDGLTIQRDTRFPVRVTLQFYQATSNGVVSNTNVKMMASQIKKVYGKGDYVGSLVVPTELDRMRPTNWVGVSTAPMDIWNYLPGLVERIGTYGWRRPGAGVM